MVLALGRPLGVKRLWRDDVELNFGQVDVIAGPEGGLIVVEWDILWRLLLHRQLGHMLALFDRMAPVRGRLVEAVLEQTPCGRAAGVVDIGEVESVARIWSLILRLL